MEGLAGDNDNSAVVIPDNPFGLTDQQMQQLQDEGQSVSYQSKSWY